MARLSILLLMCVMVVGCGTFEPKPGMTVKELNSMSALSFKGNIVRAGGFNNIGVDIYETSNQNRRRVRNATPPEGGWTFVYVRGGRVISEQEVRNLQAEAEKSAQQKPRTTPGPVASRSAASSTGAGSTGMAAINNLMRTDGYWFLPDGKSVPKSSREKCNAIIASSDYLIAFRRYTPSDVTIYIVKGGKHPYKNKIPDPAPELRRITIQNVASKNNLVSFNYSIHGLEGDVIGYEAILDIASMQLTERRVSCERCTDTQRRIFERTGNRPITHYWCSL